MSTPWSTQQLAEFLAALSSIGTATDVAWTTVERVAEELDAEVAALVCRDQLMAAVGYPDGAAPVADLTALTPGADGRLDVPDVGVCSARAVHLEHPVGAMLVVARCGPALAPQEASLLRGIAHACSVTLRMLSLLEQERAAREESARRQRQLEQLANEQTALRRVATLVARGASPPETFSAVAAQVGQVLGADSTAVLRFEPYETCTVIGSWSVSGVSALSGTGLIMTGRGVGVSVRRTARPVRIEGFEGPPGSAADQYRRLGMNFGVGAPITVEAGLWGAVVATSRRDEQLPTGSEFRIAEFTELLGSAIANAQARLDLRRVADEQAALRRVATLVARSAPPEEVFAAVAAEVGRLLECDFTLMNRYDPDGLVTVVGGWSGCELPLPVPVGGRMNIDGHNASMRVRQTGQSVRMRDLGADAGEGPSAFITAGMRTAVGAPVTVDGRLWGVTIAVWCEDPPLPTDTETRLAGFTELVATAIANAEAHAALAASRARIVATADATRQRIERDLHDGAQQRLVALALRIRAAHAAVPAELEELSVELDSICAGLVAAGDELREIARGIHPAILVERGLTAALAGLARRSPVPVELDVQVPALPERVEVTAYYVVSEALTNVIKHADASFVHVAVHPVDGVVRLTVTDDGVGGAAPSPGSGLVGLMDRVEAIAGTLTLLSGPERGTRLVVELPVDTKEVWT